MNLVKVSNNILINPAYISYVEQKNVRGKTVIIVCVSGKDFEVDRNFEDFWKDLAK